MPRSSVHQFRAFYAELITAGLQPAGERLRSAFERVPRELFLGRGPWQVVSGSGYIETPSGDTAFVYQDVVIALSPAQRLNNGLPSLHAQCLNAIAPRRGERVLHIGGGTGYYSAVLAELVGPTGNVHVMEIDSQLARLAKSNLRDWPTVVVEPRSGISGELPTSDVIYVSAGSTAPLRVWLQALNPGGRLLFPLTPGNDRGAMLRVIRLRRGFAANFVREAYFIPCNGAQAAREKRELVQAFARGDWLAVRQLYLDRAPDRTCWVKGRNWWLSTRPIS